MFSKNFPKFEQINFEKDVLKFLYKNKNEKMERKKKTQGWEEYFSTCNRLSTFNHYLTMKKVGYDQGRTQKF
jgi:hypothetical protein